MHLSIMHTDKLLRCRPGILDVSELSLKMNCDITLQNIHTISNPSY